MLKKLGTNTRWTAADIYSSKTESDDNFVGVTRYLLAGSTGQLYPDRQTRWPDEWIFSRLFESTSSSHSIPLHRHVFQCSQRSLSPLTLFYRYSSSPNGSQRGRYCLLCTWHFARKIQRITSDWSEEEMHPEPRQSQRWFCCHSAADSGQFDGPVIPDECSKHPKDLSSIG